MQVIILNAPPKAGKDTIASFLKEAHITHCYVEKFAEPLKRTIPPLYNITFDDWRENLDTPANKDKQFPQLFWKTPREVQIALSEQMLKYLHGEDILGKLLLRRLEAFTNFNYEAVVIADGGFREEILQLVDRFGANNTHIWQIHRKGCTFEYDSRAYVDGKPFGVRTLQIHNNKSLEDLKSLVCRLYASTVQGYIVDSDGVEETMDSYNTRRTLELEEILHEYNQVD